MCIRDSPYAVDLAVLLDSIGDDGLDLVVVAVAESDFYNVCLLYTSDAADERSSVDLGGRRIIKKKNSINTLVLSLMRKNTHIT